MTKKIGSYLNLFVALSMILALFVASPVGAQEGPQPTGPKGDREGWPTATYYSEEMGDRKSVV